MEEVPEDKFREALAAQIGKFIWKGLLELYRLVPLLKFGTRVQ